MKLTYASPVPSYILLAMLFHPLASAQLGKSADSSHKPKVQTTPAATAETVKETPKPTIKFLVIDGSFPKTSYTQEAIKACQNKPTDCFAVTTLDSNLVAGTIRLYSISATQITLTLEPTSNSAGDPAFAYIGLADQPKNRYPINGAASTRHQVIAGSFCMSEGVGLCAKGGLLTGSIFDRPEGVSYPITVGSITPTRVVISYSVPTDFTPRSILLSRLAPDETSDGKNDAIGNFPFKPAPTEVKNQLVYQAYDLRTLCKPNENAADCLTHIAVTSPDQPDSRFDQLAMQDSLLFLSVTMSDGIPPNTAIAFSKTADSKKTVLLRRVTRLSSEQSLVDVQMTIMDQETVRRDFGRRIAEHYLAVTLDVANRTSKKLQFSKSDVWFDADFRAVGDPSRHAGLYFVTIADAATAGTLVTPNIYSPAFDPYTKQDYDFCRKRGNLVDKKADNAKTDTFCEQVFYRYGIEQSARVAPVNYMTALAAFDYTTEKTDSVLRFIELLGATLMPLSNGNIIAQVHNTAFRDSVSIFTGTFMPGFRALELNPAHINRLRSNLVSQTLQETIAIPPTGKVSTVVLLPRDGMLAMRGRDQSVVIDRLVDVHIDPDVVNASKDGPVPADVVQIGYTKDQVRQALGEPYKMTPDEATGQTTFSYRTGAYSEVTFNKEGRVIASTQYTDAQQLAQQTSLPEATDFLRKKNLSWTRLSLLNGNSILVDIPTMDHAVVPLFDSKDKLIGTYTLLYQAILDAAAKTPAKADFYTTLKTMYLGLSPYPQPSGTGGNNGNLTYVMPDVAGGSIVVTLDSTGNILQPKPVFTGSKAASFAPLKVVPAVAGASPPAASANTAAGPAK